MKVTGEGYLSFGKVCLEGEKVWMSCVKGEGRGNFWCFYSFISIIFY